MASNLKIGTALRNYVVDNGFISAMGSADLNIYTGEQPASPETAASGTLLATINLNSAMGAASNGTSTLGTSQSAEAVATGTAGYARLISGTYILDGSVGTSGADFNLNTLSIVDGGQVTLLSMTVTQPASAA